MRQPVWLTIALWITGLLFIAAGANHFISPSFYERIVPPYLPRADWLVAISGIAEVAGGIGLLLPRLRTAAGWGLIALLVAIFPANIYVAMNPAEVGLDHIPTWLHWLRLPLQPMMIVWVWWIAIGRAPSISRPRI